MSKLLFITQKVDKNDDILGAYHRWIECLAEKIEALNVICLYKGRSELPTKVGVFSLGKKIADLRGSGIRRGFTRIRYALRFYKYIFSLRDKYDAVFVHMNPIYIILGGLFWKLSGKKIFLWYNHPMGNLVAKIGIKLADKVFCTSPYSFSAKYKKTSLMPAGIDTNFFRPMPEISKDNKQILYLGRISPIKKVEYLIEAAKILDNQGLDFKILIVGSPSYSIVDKEYELKLRKVSAGLLSKNKIEFKPAIPNHKTPEVYNSSGIFVNLTPTGSLDKTTLEAMACESLVLVSNRAFGLLFDPDVRLLRMLFRENDVVDLVAKIKTILSFPVPKQLELSKRLRAIVAQQHNLTRLINILADELV